jgi:hypothetical protein
MTANSLQTQTLRLARSDGFRFTGRALATTRAQLTDNQWIHFLFLGGANNPARSMRAIRILRY